MQASRDPIRQLYHRIRRNRLVRTIAGNNRVAQVRPFLKQKAASRPEKFLMVAFYDPKGISTILENIQCWAELSRFEMDIVNLAESDHIDGLELPLSVDLNQYAGVIVHCTVAYNVANLVTLDRTLKKKFRDYGGLKILMKQDEHLKARLTAEYIANNGFHAVITVAPNEAVARQIYSPEITGDVKFVFSLTGYVSDRMQKLKHLPFHQRPIDVGYRGSLQPFSFGRLAFEKQEIGERFKAIGEQFGLKSDISSRWEDRFLGDQWFEFLGRIKCVLGVESGSCVVDYDGRIESECAALLKVNPDIPFEEVFDRVLKDVEGNVPYKTISPRHFEAAASRTLQVLYEGQYLGIFHADRHYVPLKRDFSNVREVVEKMKDERVFRSMTEAAFEEIICNPKYGYPHFVRQVDDLAEMFFDSNK